MASRQIPSRWRTLTRPSHVIQSRAPLSYSRHFSYIASTPFSLALPAAVQLNIPSLLAGIWESILRAVPKKKTSHMKKRHRFMAGKALKDVTALNKCSACGTVKRAHLLCPYCVKGWFRPTLERKAESDRVAQIFEIRGWGRRSRRRRMRRPRLRYDLWRSGHGLAISA